MTEKLESQIAEAASHEDIQALLHAEPQETAERTAKPAKTEPEPQSEPVVYTRTETIGGREFTFEADTAAELDQMVLNAYRVASAVTEPEPKVTEAPVIDPAVETMRRVELEMKFKRGEISPSEYLEQTGAVAEYLASQGVPVDALKKTVEAQETRAVEQSWSDAVTQFLASPAGQDWPGGDQNKDMIGLQISALNLIDAPDKVAALAQAYQVMKQRNMIFDGSAPTQEQQSTQQPRPRTEPAPARARAQSTQHTQHQTRQSNSSSLWGTSSGTSANDMRDRSQQPIPAAKVIPADARPEEILAAWKENLLSNGQNPDQQFVETFRGSRK